MLNKYFVGIHKFNANNTLSFILIPFSVSLWGGLNKLAGEGGGGGNLLKKVEIWPKSA